MRLGMSVVRRSFTFSNVCSFLALTIALGTGTAYAANTVFSTDIVDGEVKTADLADNGVTTAKITNNQVYSGDVRDDTLLNGGLTSADLATNSVGANEIAANAVTSSKVGANALTGADINESTLAGVNAGTVGGMSLKKVNFQVPHGTGITRVLDFPGNFHINAECQDFGDGLDVNAFSDQPNGTLTAFSGFTFLFNDANTLQEAARGDSTDLDPEDRFEVDNVFFSNASKWVSIDFSLPSGFVAHVNLYVDRFGTTNQPGCILTGTAIGG